MENVVKEIYVKSVLNKHKKRDEWFLDDYSLNPYRLCQFNCVYCYIRGSRYGENMGKELAVKVNAPTVLARELKRRANKKEYGFIALGSATEPWMPIEEKYMVTRRCLEIIARYRFPVHCLTKSTLIQRDLDLLKEIDRNAVLPEDLKTLKHGVLITFSLSTLREEIAKIFEPGAPSPEERLEALKKVKKEGFYAGIAYIPVLPFISDSDEELEEMTKTAKRLQVDYVFFGTLTLQGESRNLYFRVLRKNFPQLVEKYRRIYVKWYPLKKYCNAFYRKTYSLCKKYNVKIGIIELK